MKIVAALPWYDESISFLDRCVRSLAGVVDELVALDGRWELYDDEAPILSHWSQGQAISVAARAAEIECRVFTGPSVWPTQVAKRAELMEIASARGDWVLVIDADEYVADADPVLLRGALKLTNLDVAQVRCTSLNGDRPDMAIRRLFRSGTTVERAHNGYRFRDQWLHGDSARVRLAQPLDLSDFLVLHDLSGMRDPERNDKAYGYRQRRARHHLEWST